MKLSTRTNRTAFPAALAGLLTAGVVSASALAGPPVQYRWVQPGEGLIDPGEIGDASLVMNDAGVLFSSIETHDRRSGIAVRMGDDWEWAVEPTVTIFESIETGAWWTSGGIDDNLGGMCVLQLTTSETGDLYRLLDMQRVGGVWVEREIVILSGLVSFSRNNAGQTAWQEHSDTPIMIDRNGSVSVLIEADDPWDNSNRLLRLFDNATALIRVFSSPDFEWFYNGALDDDVGIDWYGAPIYVSTNGAGEWVIHTDDYWDDEQERLWWSPQWPAATPAFDLKTGDTEFDAFGVRSYAVSNSGRVVFFATLDNGTSGLFFGPDPVQDALLFSTDTVLGEAFELVTVRSFTASDELVLLVELPSGAGRFAIATLCPADVNRDAVFDNADIGDFVSLFLDGSMRSDFNNDGFLDNGDITEFITQFLDGC